QRTGFGGDRRSAFRQDLGGDRDLVRSTHRRAEAHRGRRRQGHRLGDEEDQLSRRRRRHGEDQARGRGEARREGDRRGRARAHPERQRMKILSLVLLAGCILPVSTGAPMPATTVGQGKVGFAMSGEAPVLDLIANNKDATNNDYTSTYGESPAA